MNIQLALGFILATLLVCACAAQDTPPNQNTPPNTTSADEHKARELKLVALLNQKLTEAKAARDAGDWNKAIAILEEASTIDPSRDLLWFKLAEAYRGAGRYAEAATAYKKAIAIKPIGAYYNNLGEAEHKLGNFRSAVEAYRGAVQADPGNAFQYYFNIGAIETNTGDFEAANAAYDDAIRANPGFAVPYYFKGLNLLSDSQTVHGKEVVPLEASQVFQKYLELAPAGQYAALTRQTLQFIAGNLVTTYSKTSSPDRPSADQHKGEPRRDIPEGAANMFILRKVQPSYPELARNARIQGPVIFDALISEDGDILSVGVLAGNPFLVQAALDAVKQWKYNRFPFIREPATVQTQIWVNFALTSEPQPGPVRLRLPDILQLLQNGLAPDRVASLIHECKVSFDMTDPTEHQLREAGGNDAVVQAIKSNRP